MANHFSTVGFEVRSEKTFVVFVEQIMKYGVDVAFVGGETTRWTLDCGIDQWAQTRIFGDDTEEFVGVQLHHLGATRMTCEICEVLASPAGFDEATLEPHDEAVEGKLRLSWPGAAGVVTEVRVDAIDYAQQRALYTVGTKHVFQVAAFVRALSGANEALPEVPETSADPLEKALILRGTVHNPALKENGDTDLPYWHAQFQTGAQYMELVCDPAVAKGLLVEGAEVTIRAVLTTILADATG